MNDDQQLLIQSMVRELETDPIFLNSEFWKDINQKNTDMLSSGGIENFKRTVSQNYYNWLILFQNDPQFTCAMAEWRRHPSLWPFLTRIEKNINLQVLFASGSYALKDKEAYLYRMFVSCLWETMLRADKNGLHKKLREPEVGNPIRIWRKGRLISQDLANSIIECNTIVELLSHDNKKPRVAEIGAGYGRLAHVYAQTQPGTYFIFDIPPALYVSQWYLSRVFTNKKIFHFRPFDDFSNVQEEMEAADIVFLSANQIRKFPEQYFDLILSISTMPEMTMEQVSLYFELFDKLSSRFVFLKQWIEWKNPLDGTYLQPSHYGLGPNWELVMDRIDLTNPQFFNKAWKRLKT